MHPAIWLLTDFPVIMQRILPSLRPFVARQAASIARAAPVRTIVTVPARPLVARHLEARASAASAPWSRRSLTNEAAFKSNKDVNYAEIKKLSSQPTEVGRRSCLRIYGRD